MGNSNLIEKMPPVRAVLSSDLASRTYPAVRRVLTDTFAMVLMATQKYSFGCHVQESSPESYNIEIGDALYDWSLRVLGPWL